MIQPIQLGKRVFSTNLIQGPLAGVSCAPFRRPIWQYSEPAYTCTEMISCKTLIHQAPKDVRRFVEKDSEEGPLCFQLSGNEPQELEEAVKRATDYGADLIDLNCGCPVKKIRGKGAGSFLLSDAGKLYQLIRAMKENTTVPVSIKIRVDGGSQEKFNQEIVKVVQDAGVDFLIVHGRHWTEHYETPCRYDEIQYFVNELKLPVIGNGDISCLASLKSMFATGCAGVMIARAGMGQPWLIQQLIMEARGMPYQAPDSAERAKLFLTHIRDLKVLLESEKFAMLQGRKFAKYYARHLANRADFCEEVNTCEDILTLAKICERYF